MSLERLQKEVSKLVKELGNGEAEGMKNILGSTADEICQSLSKGDYDPGTLGKRFSQIQFALLYLADKYKIDLSKRVEDVVDKGYKERNLNYLTED